MKKLLGLLLAAMLVLSLFSGAAVAESRKEFTFWAAYNPTYQLDWEGMKCWKLLEEATGIHINWVLYANSGEMKEKLGVLLGTGTTSSFPDAFFRCSINANQLKKYGPEGLFMDITDLVKEYAPNACAAIDKMDGWSIVSDPSTSEIYSLPCITDSLSGRMLPKLFINVEMMHNVGVDKMPETLDEFYDLLVKVRENDSNGNGDPNDEVGIVTNTLDRYINLFSGAFGIHNRGREDMLVDADPADETKIRFVYTTDEYRALLSFVNRLYEEKLIDQNMLTPSTSNMVALGSQNQIFALAYTNMAAAAVDESKYEPLTLSLTGPGGNAWNTLNKGFGVGNFVISNTVSKEDAITLIKWADTLFTLDGARMLYFGEENVDYTLDENGYPNYVDSILSQVSSDNPYDKVISAITCFASGGIPGYKDDIWNCGSECRGKALEAAQNMEQFANKITWSFNFTIDENDELSALKTDIVNNCHNVYRAKFIEGTLDVDDDAVWNQYLEEIQNAGLEDLIAIYQTALDRMLAK